MYDKGRRGATHLGMEVQDRDFPLFHEVHDCFYGNTIEVALVLPMLQEMSIAYLPLHLLARHKVVVLAIHLTWSHGSAGVCSEGGREGRERERVRMGDIRALHHQSCVCTCTTVTAAKSLKRLNRDTHSRGTQVEKCSGLLSISLRTSVFLPIPGAPVVGKREREQKDSRYAHHI